MPPATPAGAVSHVDARSLIQAWQTTNGATVYLVRHLPTDVWSSPVPGVPRLTAGMIAAHLHNIRCRWIKSLGTAHGVRAPRLVDQRRVQPRDLVQALARSSHGIVELIELGLARGGRVPPSAWQNFPTDIGHFVSYFVAHEAHHRGQLCMVARQLGRRLPPAVSAGIWQWTRLSRQSARKTRTPASALASPEGRQ
jgi:uncharacterized damage-inducible protein DinB